MHIKKLEAKAWEIYCEETSGGLHVADFWEELPKSVQEIYIKKATPENGKIEFVLQSDDLIKHCHDEIVALAAKMAEFNQGNHSTK